MTLDEIRYTSKGKKIGEGSEMRILSVREAESEKYQFEGEHPNSITMTYEEFKVELEKAKNDL